MSFAKASEGLPKKSATLHRMAPKNNPRFAGIVAATFSALGVTQEVFQKDLGGPSDTTLRKIVDGEPVGISTRTLNALDKAFRWTYGSAARTLSGGDPTPISAEADFFMETMRHPSRRDLAVQMEEGGDLSGVLDRVLSSGQLSKSDRLLVEEARDDIAIENLPRVFESLSRDGKLKVVQMANEIWLSEARQRAELKEKNHVVDQTETAGTSTEAGQNQEAKLAAADELDKRTTGGMAAVVGTDDPGVDGGQDGEERHRLPGG